METINIAAARVLEDPVLVKSAILLGTFAIFNRGITPPTAAPAPRDAVIKRRLFDYAPRALAYLWQLQFFALVVSHVTVMYLLKEGHTKEDSPALATLCPAPSPSLARLTSLTPRFLAGVAVMLSGSLLRTWCYRTLGRMFTFEVRVVKDHALVTAGPYSWVRHPSYTGMWLAALATQLVGFGADEYFAVCGLGGTTLAKWSEYYWYASISHAAWALYGRATTEDVMLREQFGETWDKWAKRTPYRFIPYIL